MTPLRVAIVGAGIAGLGAATALAGAGASVQIFDKGRSVGGRVATRRTGEQQFDHGAQFFTVRDPAFAERIEGLVRTGHVAVWSGPFRSWQDGQFGPDPRPGQRRYVGMPGMSGLPRGLAEGLAVCCGWRVERLERRGSRTWLHGTVVATGAKASRGPFDQVVVALPPAQVAALLTDALAGSPVAVAARELHSALQPCLAAMVGFAAPVAGAEGGLFLRDEVLGWAAHDGGKPGRGEASTYVLHATAAWSAAHFEAEPTDTAGALVAEFARVLGVLLPPVVHLAGHRWRYAHAVDVQRQQPFVRDVGNGLCLVGDALVGGRVEGAFCSGRAAAQALLADCRL